MIAYKDFLKKLYEAVEEPRSEAEDHFIKKHPIKIIDYPVKQPKPFKLKKDKSRKADYQDGEDAKIYEDVDDLVTAALDKNINIFSNFLSTGDYIFADGSQKYLTMDDVDKFQQIYDDTFNKEQLVSDALKSRKNFEDLITLSTIAGQNDQ